MRRKVTGAVDAGLPKAEALAWRPEMYRLASPPAGVDRDVVDKLWDPVENGLRDLAVRLAARRLQPGDDMMLFDYAATAGVRHPRCRRIRRRDEGRVDPSSDDRDAGAADRDVDERAVCRDAS